ncbi:hypothetical protein EXIGLDRAFT_843707 [Exidia glandulosa HHB12029]|uniref:Family A G protein-coupled receptor-like protein n=1 Tax=Exidia glandulosa HHB12029 TaxID=1314781 RepID=A0A165CH47_EXIGL|nr:hypothetical protein EXIGLDRAFT_843707 [Exidia glandulosa HHB12029]
MSQLPEDTPTDQVLPVEILPVMRDFVSVFTESVFFGIYIAIYPVAMYHLLKRTRTKRSSWPIAAVITVMFLISVYQWSSAVGIVMQREVTMFLHTEGTMVQRIRLANAQTTKPSYASELLFVQQFILGDAVIAWRLLVIHNWARWLFVILASLWLGTVATGFGLIGCLAHAEFPIYDSPRLCTELENVSWLLSLTFNGFATVMFALLARSHRKMSRVLDEKRKTKVDRVLMVLVISGIIYFILGLPRLSSFANPSILPFFSRLTWATEVIESALDQIVGIYPTAVTAFLFYESKMFSSPSAASYDGTGQSHTLTTLRFAKNSTTVATASGVAPSQGLSSTTARSVVLADRDDNSDIMDKA